MQPRQQSPAPLWTQAGLLQVQVPPSQELQAVFLSSSILIQAPGTPELRMGPWILGPEKKVDHPLEWLLPALTRKLWVSGARDAESQG